MPMPSNSKCIHSYADAAPVRSDIGAREMSEIQKRPAQLTVYGSVPTVGEGFLGFN